MKILYITTIGSTMDFFKSFIREQLDIGNQIDIATNENNGETRVAQCYREWGCGIFHIDSSRSPVSIGNIRAIKQLRLIIKRKHYDLVHCHTPVAAAITRIACKDLREKGVKVVYTAHGFHFYDGAPQKNWLIYYPIEKILSKYTDVLITINQEDYKRAHTKFYSDKVLYVPGVGLDVNRFTLNKYKRDKIRNELHLREDRVILLSVGELNENKNHENVINAIRDIDNITYVIVGKGALYNRLEFIAKKNNVDLRLMGERSDVDVFYAAADIYILPSMREGLNVSLMEAMAASRICLASKIRGNVDLVDEGKGGWLFNPKSYDEIRKVIKKTIDIDYESKRKMGEYNKRKISQYDCRIVNRIMMDIYKG